MPSISEAPVSATMFEGWALVAGGRVDEGVACLRDGFLRWRQTGSKSLGPFRLARVADGLLLAGEAVEAAAVLVEASAIAEETGEHWSDPELHRLSGIAKLRQSGETAGIKQAEHLPSSGDNQRAQERPKFD